MATAISSPIRRSPGARCIAFRGGRARLQYGPRAARTHGHRAQATSPFPLRARPARCFETTPASHVFISNTGERGGLLADLRLDGFEVRHSHEPDCVGLSAQGGYWEHGQALRSRWSSGSTYKCVSSKAANVSRPQSARAEP